MNDNSDDITRLETMIAHQEKQITDLSDMTSSQWREIDTLKQQVYYLISRFKDMEQDHSTSKADRVQTVSEMAAAEKPPHY
ncbi:MAG: SlyX family protein [Alphaproteobacteria bacterium]|nr:SlyX family protein [Alphaproteobacteria bacterium]MCB9984463.1 SlyX family protein [Micavibrio sp.]MCB1551455.1 SlyX family protein [Alphaproteobacteria bacterium]HPQ51038.1 SlyX family protein [Alphaproteobacteria bacterium]HRK97771.1 SlyX family protein [Alphaproteobacteria bacterium]